MLNLMGGGCMGRGIKMFLKWPRLSNGSTYRKNSLETVFSGRDAGQAADEARILRNYRLRVLAHCGWDGIVNRV